jgi:GNAT superfamily N-acetyltransferase
MAQSTAWHRRSRPTLPAMAIRILDVIDDAGFALVPPCADAGFDHRSCDYWEDADRGSKAARASWLSPFAPAPATRSKPRDPFGGDDEPAFNPFAAAASGPAFNPFVADDDAPFNPFAPQPKAAPSMGNGALPKLRLLARGATVFGSYAKVLLLDELPAAYIQFGPLSAYPRAMRTRDLYPKLPQSPPPAVITCIATTAAARGCGYAALLVEEVCDDLARRGFSAVETYPEVGAKPDATSAAQPGFWTNLGFAVAAADERFPVLRRELG